MLYFKGIQYFRENLFWFCVCVRDWSGGGACFLLNCPIYFGKPKLHCFVNCINGFLHVQIPQLFGGFN